ncbi:hypothetical protein Tco_0869458 [Tanacetum coccineum]
MEEMQMIGGIVQIIEMVVVVAGSSWSTLFGGIPRSTISTFRGATAWSDCMVGGSDDLLFKCQGCVLFVTRFNASCQENAISDNDDIYKDQGVLNAFSVVEKNSFVNPYPEIGKTKDQYAVSIKKIRRIRAWTSPNYHQESKINMPYPDYPYAVSKILLKNILEAIKDIKRGPYSKLPSIRRIDLPDMAYRPLFQQLYKLIPESTFRCAKPYFRNPNSRSRFSEP